MESCGVTAVPGLYIDIGQNVSMTRIRMSFLIASYTAQRFNLAAALLSPGL